MASYVVSVKEVWINRYRVKAYNEEEAKQKVIEGSMNEDYYPVRLNGKPITYVEMGEITCVREGS